MMEVAIKRRWNLVILAGFGLSLIAYSDYYSLRPPFIRTPTGPLALSPEAGAVTMGMGPKDQFVTVPLCTETDEPVWVRNLSFKATVMGDATPRFRVNFKPTEEDNWGAASVDVLSKRYVDAEGAAGEVRPCDQIPGRADIAFILDRDQPVGVFADGFEMTYSIGGQDYTAREGTALGVCASQGPNPEPIVENCETIER